MTANQLKEWRRYYGYDQKRLANLLGVHVQTVSRWERKVQPIPAFLHLALDTLVSQETVRFFGRRRVELNVLRNTIGAGDLEDAYQLITRLLEQKTPKLRKKRR